MRQRQRSRWCISSPAARTGHARAMQRTSFNATSAAASHVAPALHAPIGHKQAVLGSGGWPSSARVHTRLHGLAVPVARVALRHVVALVRAPRAASLVLPRVRARPTAPATRARALAAPALAAHIPLVCVAACSRIAAAAAAAAGRAQQRLLLLARRALSTEQVDGLRGMAALAVRGLEVNRIVRTAQTRAAARRCSGNRGGRAPGHATPLHAATRCAFATCCTLPPAARCQLWPAASGPNGPMARNRGRVRVACTHLIVVRNRQTQWLARNRGRVRARTSSLYVASSAPVQLYRTHEMW